jgi:SpoVK/Ycf46/Vps4 family AAA+-type ATPase
MARVYHSLGLLSKGHLVEVGRGDLVGKYVGWTAQNVQSKFKAAKGGVLFIDEAYSLVDDRGGSFGDEAINTIVQEMENHREDVVVIFAGYPDKMEGFLQKNPRLRSRIAFHVPFADYSTEELCEIARHIGRAKGMSIEDGAIDKLKILFDTARLQDDFGNGRYVRNVFDQAKMNQATRLLAFDLDRITDAELSIIRADDIVAPPRPKNNVIQKIGFC